MAVLSRRKFGAVLGAAPLTLLAGALGASAGAASHQISIRKFKFAPEKLEVSVGDEVIWTNLDIAPHTATEQEMLDWDTGPLERKEKAAVVFDKPGVYAYFCVFHPHMKGVIVVKG